MSAAAVLPLSSDSATDGLEVSLFLNPAFLFSCYYETCSDERIRLLAEADARRARRQREALGELQRTQPEAAERIGEEERLIDDMIALADSTADIHLPNRPSDAPPDDDTADATSAPPPPIPALLYSSLQYKRAQVLRALHAHTRADIEHFHRRHSPGTAAAVSSAVPPATATSALTRLDPHRRVATYAAPTFSSVPPLLRWSLLSLFPLIDSVSRVDPALRVHTIRLLLEVLHSSPPLSLYDEADSTIALVQSLLAGSPASPLSAVASGDMHSARIALAVQRGQLRHILAAVEPLLTSSDEEQSAADEWALVDIQPSLRTLQQYAASQPQLCVLTEDTLLCQWRHHTIAQPEPQRQPQPALPAVAEQARVLAQPQAAAHSSVDESLASPESAAALMASYITPLLGGASEREAADAAAAELFSPPAATTSTSTAPSSTVPPSSTPSAAASAAPAFSPRSPAPSPSLPQYGCMATDGVYHFVHTQRGLHKCGSGHGGSVQGHVYDSEPQPFASLLPELPASLASVLSPDSCYHVYGGWLAYVAGSLLFRSSLFILAQPELLAVRIDPRTLSAVELVWADADSYESVRADSSRGSVRWFHAMTDGDHLLVLREQHRDRHCFYLDRFAPAPSSAAPPASAAAASSTVRSSCMRLLSSTELPCGYTQFPSAHRYTRSLASLLSPYQFHVGQKVQALDSINKWCPAVVVELTASRALVHYDGWASRWDEWIALDSNRIVRRGEAADRDGSAAGKDGEAGGRRKKVNANGGGVSGAAGGGAELDEAEWFYSAHRSSTSASAAAAVEDWLPHSSLNNSKLEQAYLALTSSTPLGQAAIASNATSPAPSALLTIRSARQSFDADVAGLTQVDCHTGQRLFLKRRSLADSHSFAFLEDVHCAVTGSQLLCVLPALCPPNATRQPVLRLFELPSRPDGEAHWMSDVRLWSAQARSLPSSLANAFTHPSHQADARLSALCFDSAHNELLSYHSSEQLVRRWRNASPRGGHSRRRVEVRSAEEDEEDRRTEVDSLLPLTNVDVTELPQLDAAVEESPRSPLSLSAALLLRVSSFCQLCPPAASSDSIASLQPFCIDVDASSFSHLHRLLTHCWHQLHSAAQSAPLLLSCCSSLLRLLEANLQRLPAHAVDSADWQPVLTAISRLLIDISSASSLLTASLRPQSDDCLQAGFSSFFASPPDIVLFLTSRLSASSLRQRLLDGLSTSDRLMALFPLDSGGEHVADLLLSCLDSCEREALAQLEAVRQQSAAQPCMHESADEATPALLLSSSLQLSLRLQRYLLSVSEAGVGEPFSSAGSAWTAVFRAYCQQLASLSSDIVSVAADVVTSERTLAAAASSALAATPVGVLLPSVLAFLYDRPSDSQALLACFLPLLQQLDRLNRAVHASEPALSSALCLSASTLLCPLPSQFTSTSLESPHPYSAGTIDRQLSLPGSAYVCVDLSPLCCSRNGNDALKLSQPDGWSLVCSGGSSARAGSRGWPRWMVRRTGESVAVFWTVEASKADGKDGSLKSSHGNDWGWKVTLFGFTPHPVPRVTSDGKEGPLDALFDLQMSGTTALSRALRSALTSAAEGDNASQAAYEWEKQAQALEQSAVDERGLAAAVNLSLLSAGLTADSSVQQSDVSAATERRLLEELTELTSTPASQAGQSSPQPLARLLLDALSSHIAGRPAMTPAMRRTIEPVEASVLAALLVHSRLLSTAAEFVRSWQAEQLQPTTESVDSASARTPAAAETTPSNLSATATALNTSLPRTASSAHLVFRTSKRELSATQLARLALLTSLVQSGVHRVLSWLLHRAQLDKRWQLLVDDAAQHVRAHQLEQQQLDEQSRVEHIPAYGVTVQSLLLAAVAANRSPPSHLPSDLDALIRERLSVLSVDELRLLTTEQRLPWRDSDVEQCVAQLAATVRRLAIEAAKLADAPLSAAGSLDRLALRACSMATFLCAFQPAAAEPPAVSTAVPLTESVGSVCAFLFAGCSTVSSAAVAAALQARTARSRDRALAYDSLSTALSCIHIASSRDALLASLPPRALLVDDLQGCSRTDIARVYERYQHFVERLAHAAQQSVQAAPTTPPSPIAIDCLLVHANALATSSCIHPLPIVASVVECLLSLHLNLSPCASSLLDSPLPPLSSTLLFSSSPSAPPLCSFVLTDSNHTELSIYQCVTCGFTDGKVICASCARSCHASHEVSLLKQGTAFCDCWLFCGDKCAGMHWSARSRQKRQLCAQLDECRMAASDLIVKALESDDAHSSGERLLLQLCLLRHIAVQAERCDEPLAEELLHALLSCAFRVRRRLLFSDVSPLDAAPQTGELPLCFSSPTDFGGVLLRLWSAASLRCQRLALRLLSHLLPRTAPLGVTLTCMPRSFPFPHTQDVVSTESADGAVQLLAAVLASVGDAVLHSSHSPMGASELAERQADNADSEGPLIAAAEDESSKSAQAACHLLLRRPSSDSTSALLNSSVSSFVSSFVDRCGADVLHYQHIQALLDASTTAANGSVALQPAPSSSDGGAGKAQLDAAYRKQLTKQLSEAQEATVFDGQHHLCSELGSKLAAHGLLLRVEARVESAGQSRNEAVVAPHRTAQGWQRRRGTGRQTLSLASELILLFRTLLLAADTGCAAQWQQRAEQSLFSHLAYLSAGEYAPLRVDGLVSGWRVELLAAVGALAVATGSTGYELPALGAAVRVTNSDSVSDELTASTLRSSVGSAPPNSVEPNSVAAVTAALCSPLSAGRVVYIDEGGSETRVVRDGDRRRAAERVHWTRVASALPPSLDDAVLLAPERAEVRLALAKSAVLALSALAAAPARDAAAVTRTVWAMLQARLLRLVATLAADSDVALHLFANQSVLDSVVLAALSPAVTVEWRTCSLECSRAMELLADLTLQQRLKRQRTLRAAITQTEPSTGWRRDTAVRCVLTDNDRTARYSGARFSNAVKRMKVNIDELLPTLLLATRAWALTPQSAALSPTATSFSPPRPSSPRHHCYFEVSVLSDVATLSVGVAPEILPAASTSVSRAASSAQSLSLSGPPLHSSAATSSATASAHLFGWPEGSVLYCSDGSKARFWHAVRTVGASPLRVHDLVDVRDSAAGKWQQAVVAGESDDSLRVHYLQWDDKYDELLPRDSDRLDTLLTRTRYTNRTAAEQRAVTGQLWREPYAQPFSKGDVVGCGYSEQAGGVYFTINGRYLGVAYRQNLASRLLPAVCLHDADTTVAANFDGPFVYEPGPELTERPAAAASHASGGEPSAGSSEALWADGGGSDISSSLRLFNDPSHSGAASVAQRLTPFEPLPSAAVYRRHELADEMRCTGVFPDLSLAQLLLALDMSGDELPRAMELAYCQSSLLAQAALDDEQARSSASSVTPVAPLFSPAQRTMFPTTQSAANASASSFFSGPFNSTPPAGRGPRMSSVSLPRRTGLLSAASPASPASASSSPFSASSVAAAVDDGFDDFLFDDDSFRGGSGVSAANSGISAVQHAYSLDSLSSGGRSVNHYHASEWSELQFMAHRERSSRAADSGDGSGERSLPFDLPPQSALDVLQLLESIRRPSPDGGVLDVLQQLRQLSSSSDTLLFLSGARSSQLSDTGSGLFGMTGPPASTPPASISRSECVVGASVRISATAKSVCIGSLPSTGQQAVLWCDEMNDLIGRVGVITAVDWRVGLVRVLCVDQERGLAKELWWPPAALNRLITLRRRGYVAGNHPLAILPHLLSLYHKTARHMARQLLVALMPHAARLAAHSAAAQEREMARLKALLTAHTLAQDDADRASNSSTVAVHPNLPLLARETLMVWSLRHLHSFLSYDGSSIAQPVPYSKSSAEAVCGEAVAERLLGLVSSQQPQLAVQCLRHTQHLLAQSVEVNYQGSPLPTRTAPAFSQPTSSILLYRTVHVPYACCLVVTFAAVSIASGSLLSFYGASHHQRLLLQIRGQRGGRTTLPQSPFIVPSNTLWIALTAERSTSGGTAADSSSSVRLLVTPVSEQLSAGLWLAQRQLSDWQQHSEQLRSTFDVCMELLALPAHVPSFVRVPFLRLALALVRSSPRGSLGDFHSALPLFSEMLNAHSDSERDEQQQQQQGAAVRRSDSARKPQLCSPLMQLLFELHTAIVAHFYAPPQPALPTTAAAARQSAQQLPASVSRVEWSERSAVTREEEEERKLKSGEERQAEAEADPHLTVSRQLSQYLTAEYERLSTPLGLGDSEAEEAVQLAAELSSFPQWFVDGCSVLLSLRAVLSGGSWMIAADTRRRSSSIGVVTADGRSDAALPTYRPWRSGAEWFEVSERQPQQQTARRCLPLATYEQLTASLEQRAERLGKSAAALTRADVTEEFLTAHYPLLRSLPHAAVLYAATCVQSLNSLLADSFPLFDLSGAPAHTSAQSNGHHLSPDSLLALFTACRGLLFASTRLDFFHSVVAATSVASSSSPTPYLRINRLKAAAALSASSVSRLSGDRQKDAVSLLSDSLLGQTYRQLKGVSAAAMRKPRGRGGAPHVAFNVQFEGESVLGQGGPYRQLFNDLSGELQSQQLPAPLFVPTPNHAHGLGEQRHLFMPNPAATSPAQLELYEHVGRLMAVACRTRVLLSLDLPALFWKQLAAQSVGVDELREVDSGLVDGVLLPAWECASQDDFDRAGCSSLSFPVTRSDQSPVLPTPSTPVTLDTLQSYASQLLEARLSESRQQVASIRRGMSELLPVELLALLTPDELSTLFCGSPSIDVDLLSRHTEYSGGLTATTPHIEWFWSCLRSMSEEQRRQFVQFAYAQQRLPGDDSGFDTFPKLRMLIKPARGGDADVDAQLPHSDTCFFNLALPAYSSPAVMRQRLLQICEMGQWGLSGDEAALHDAVAHADLAATHNASNTAPPPPPPPPLPLPLPTPERRATISSLSSHSRNSGSRDSEGHSSSSGSSGGSSMDTEMQAMSAAASSSSHSSLLSLSALSSSFTSPTSSRVSPRFPARFGLNPSASTDGVGLRDGASRSPLAADAPVPAVSPSAASASSPASPSAPSASSFGSALTSSFRSFFSRSSPSPSSSSALSASSRSHSSSSSSTAAAFSVGPSLATSSDVGAARSFSPSDFADSLLDADEDGLAPHSSRAQRQRHNRD